MRISLTSPMAALFLFPVVTCAQAPAPVAQPIAAVTAQPRPSTVLQPALDNVRHALGYTYTDRWKRGSIRDEASENIQDILHDMEANVPPLMQTADADPWSVSKTLPLVRHVDALYDVLLRVVQAARVAAPGEQVERLQGALVTLGNTRIALENQLQQSAVAQERLLTDLHHSFDEQKAQLTALRAVPPPAPCKPSEPAKRRATRHTHRTTTHPAEKPKTPSAPAQKH